MNDNKKHASRFPIALLHAALAALVLLLPGATWAQAGRVEEVTVHGHSLEGNLDGNPVERSVFVYLPPSYDSEPERHYPVVYLLHGYGLQASRWMTLFNIEQAANNAIGRGAGEGAREMILVNPSTYTIYDGSMYSSSATAGDWESFIADDLVAWIDSHYRTIPERAARGLAGHSMGGYGTLRIGMKRPDVFSSLYALAACCMMESGEPSEDLRVAGEYATREEVVALRYPDKSVFARAAAWSPNPSKPPFYVDLPVVDGVEQPLVQAKWLANSILPMLDQHAVNLKRYDAIMFDVGLQDGLLDGNRRLSAALEQAGIAHTFEMYEGGHNDRISERIETRVLPFFSRHLRFD